MRCAACPRRIYPVVRSEFFLNVLSRNLTVPQNLSKKSPANGFTSVNRYDRAPAVGMAKETVAALDSDNLESKLTKGLDQADTRDGRKGAHAVTATR